MTLAAALPAHGTAGDGGLRRRRSLLVCTGAMLLALPRSPAAAAQTPSTGSGSPLLRLGTSTPGGGFAQYGAALERLLKQADGRPLLQARLTRGTAENLVLLQNGDIDAALIQGTAASEVLAQGEAGGLRILWAMYPSPGMLAVPTASSAQRLEDLRGQPVVFGVRSSGLVTLARQVFSGIGLDIDRDFQALYVEQAAQSPLLVQSGRAAGLWGAGDGWPGFVQLANGPGGARFIGPTAAQTAQILARHPLLQAMQLPAGSYPGMTAPLSTVGSVNLILVRDSLADDRAAAFVQAMEQAAPALAAALPQAAFGTRANTLASAPAPALLHRVLQPVRN